MIEIWRHLTIPHFEHFEVSNYGRIRNTKTGNFIAQGDNGHGYLHAKLKARPYEITVYPHILEAMEFLPDYDPSLQVNHRDEDKTNNMLWNLELVTDSQNKYWSHRSYVDGHLKTQGKTLLVYDLNGNFLFESRGLWETCRNYGFDPRAVQRVIKGEKHSHKGCIFKYKDE